MSRRVQVLLVDEIQEWVEAESKRLNLPISRFILMSLQKQKQYEEMVHMSNQVWPVLQRMTPDQINKMIEKSKKE